jgi:hypothetical protein
LKWSMFLALALGFGCNHMPMNEQAQAITHDSDLRFLPFVFRNKTTGEEQSVTPIQAIENETVDPTTIKLDYAKADYQQGYALLTKSMEIRNRNRASFQLQFTKALVQGEGTAYPAKTEDEPPAQIAVSYDDSDYFDDGPITTFDPLVLPADPGDGTGIYVTKVKVTINTAFTGEAWLGMSALARLFISGSEERILNGMELSWTDAGTSWETTDGYALRCAGQNLSWQVVASEGGDLDAAATGALTIDITYENRAPANSVVLTEGTLAQESTNLLVNVPNAFIPVGATITRVGLTELIPAQGHDGAITGRIVVNGANTVSFPVDIDASPTPTVAYYDTPFEKLSEESVQFRLESANSLADISYAIMLFDFEWVVPGEESYADWEENDSLAIVAFASLDDKQYTPISLARHDWSNTPFVDIIKLDDTLLIPADFDPGASPPTIERLDDVGFNRSIMLFLADWENLSTWNYIRFALVYYGAEGPNNREATLRILANAREL